MCDYCSDSFINLYEKDSDSLYLMNEHESILGSDVLFSVWINQYGKLALSAGDFKILGDKKINYCPMCGAKIPEKTPTKIYEEEMRF